MQGFSSFYGLTGGEKKKESKIDVFLWKPPQAGR